MIHTLLIANWAEHLHKELRAILGRPVVAPFSRVYCGGGDLGACRSSSNPERAMRSPKTAFVLAFAVLLEGLRFPPAFAQDDLDSLLSDQQARPRSEEKRPSEKETGETEAAREEPAKRRESREEAAAPVVEAPPPPEPELERPAAAAPTEVGERAPTRRVIEEIVVTAQKREQAITDVPIAMSVIGQDFIAEQAITDVRDALLFVPNVQTRQLQFGAAPVCRGFSFETGNRAFESPCGLALDGVPYTRPAYFQAALFDVRRVEVLRGPQGTTFGKNTTAGLVHLITNDPTDEFTGHVDVQLGELDRRRLEAAIGGPLFAGLLNFRAAGISDEQDGFMKNTTAEIVPGAVKRPGTRDRKGLRVKLGLPNLFGSELKLSYESVELDSSGDGVELSNIPPAAVAFIRTFDPAADFEEKNLVISNDAPGGLFIEIDTFQADWAYDFLGWSIDAVAAHSVLDETVLVDADTSAVPGALVEQTGINPTTTFEVRTLSPGLAGLYGLDELFGWKLGRSNLLAGIFYQKGRFEDSEFLTRVNAGPFLGLLASANNSPEAGIEPPSAPGTGIGGDLAREELLGVFDQDAETIAGFAQFEWHLDEQWMLQYGMRLSHETKDGKWNQSCVTESGCPVHRAGNFQEFTARRSLSELQFQPKVTLNYEPFDGVSLFAHWTRGFKGGGFNALVNGNPNDPDDPVPLSFDPETATEWGIDAKMSLLGGAARLNVSLFRLDLEDLQVFEILNDETTQLAFTRINNAGASRAQGIEADLTYLPTDWLTVIGTVGLNDTEFLEFPLGACPQGVEDTDGDGNPACDQSGRPFAFAPEWNNTLTLNVRYPLTDLPGLGGAPFLPFAGFDLGGVDLTAGYTLEFNDVQFLNTDLAPLNRQPSFFRLRANVGFGNPARGWSFRVTGENLTDKRTAVSSATFFGSSGLARRPEPSRLVFGQFRWEF